MKQVCDVYTHKTLPGFYGNYHTFMRVYLTRMMNGHEPKPLWRNLVFNIIREAWCFTYPKILFEWDTCGNHHFIEFLTDNMIKTIAYTIMFHLIPMTFHYRFKYVYYWLKAEYFFVFPMGTIFHMNGLTNMDAYKGDIVKQFLLCLIQLNDRTGLEMFEDLFFGDMGMWNMGHFNAYVGYFFPHFIMTYQLMFVEQ